MSSGREDVATDRYVVLDGLDDLLGRIQDEGPPVLADPLEAMLLDEGHGLL